MSNQTTANAGRGEKRGAPVWWLVFRRELSELWIGGRALNLLILFSVLMSITAYLLANNSELSLFSTRNTLFLALQAAITFGLFIGLVIAAESISGERERATLEGLLLTPTSRRQLVAGKFLAALSPWFAALIVAIPYLAILSRGDAALWQALFWGALVGTLVAVTFTGIGMLASIWSNSNRTSLFVSMLVFLLSLLPSQLPGEAMASILGALIQVANPLESARQFMQKTVSEGLPLDQVWSHLAAPAILAAIVLTVLFVVAAPRLRRQAGKVRIRRTLGRRMEAME